MVSFAITSEVSESGSAITLPIPAILVGLFILAVLIIFFFGFMEYMRLYRCCVAGISDIYSRYKLEKFLN